MGLDIVKGLSGKKTYLVAGGMLVVLTGLLLGGVLSPELAFEVLVFAAPCFAATYRDALQRHHTEVTELLADLVDMGVDARAHNYAALEAAGLKAAVTLGATAAPIVATGSSNTAVTIDTAKP